MGTEGVSGVLYSDALLEAPGDQLFWAPHFTGILCLEPGRMVHVTAGRELSPGDRLETEQEGNGQD